MFWIHTLVLGSDFEGTWAMVRLGLCSEVFSMATVDMVFVLLIKGPQVRKRFLKDPAFEVL